MRDAFFGSGFHDFVLRFYAFHVFFLPIALLGLMVVHFPRFLCIRCAYGNGSYRRYHADWRCISCRHGSKIQSSVPPGITVPEWYLTGLYAFLRTQFDKFVTGVAWPGLLRCTYLVFLLLTNTRNSLGRNKPLHCSRYNKPCTNHRFSLIGDSILIPTEQVIAGEIGY